MAKFFLPLIILTIVAWLIIGLQQEYNDYNKDNDKEYKDSIYSANKPSYSDSLLLDKYSDYQLMVAVNLHFLLPVSMQTSYDLTNESDAYLQFYRSQPELSCIVYKDELSSDTSAYNYSLKNYIRSTINGSRNVAVKFNMEDSVAFNLPTGEEAVFVTFSRTKLLDDGSENNRVITFLSTKDNNNLYMIYFYCDTATYKANLDDIRNVYTSTAIVKY